MEALRRFGEVGFSWIGLKTASFERAGGLQCRHNLIKTLYVNTPSNFYARTDWTPRCKIVSVAYCVASPK